MAADRIFGLLPPDQAAELHRRKEVLKEGQDIIGNRVRAKIVKNKVSPPFKIAEFDILSGGRYEFGVVRGHGWMPIKAGIPIRSNASSITSTRRPSAFSRTRIAARPVAGSVAPFWGAHD